MTIPYCGAPPIPGALDGRWNFDPVLIAGLVALTAFHVLSIGRDQRRMALIGWTVAAAALISPLCALSVSLFSARVGQHMVLVLIAGPLIGQTLPRGGWRHSPWWSAAAFSVALWVWHMPAPYDATFHSTAVYWAMHATLFGSAVWLWHDLLNHSPEETLPALGAGTMASLQMGFLGAMLSLSSHAMFTWHYATSEAWGYSPLEDQQLGGALMWVPGGVFFLWAAVRSLSFLWHQAEGSATR